MRYRQLDKNGDMVFGRSLAAFYIDEPAAVAQAVATRLKLQYGEWFLDTTDGTPWQTKVLGKYTASTRDLVIKQRVLDTPGVVAYVNYSSETVTAQRRFTVEMQIDTVYGQVILQGPI